MATRLDPRAVRAYMARDWGAARAGKRAHWQDRVRRGGLGESLAVMDQLRAWGAQLAPGWPSEEAREEDLETHQRVATALAKTAPRPARREPAERALADLAAVAARERLRWYVFGAQAVAFHGYPRMTADLDVTIDLGDRELGEIAVVLSRAGFALRFADPAFLAATRVLPVVHRASGLPVDLVLAGPGLEQLFFTRLVRRKVGRRMVPVISAEDLIASKLLAGRPKDLDDVRELLAVERDHALVEATLAALEEALGQSDLRPLYRRLRRGQ